jgi:ankyrin repeat protein
MKYFLYISVFFILGCNNTLKDTEVFLEAVRSENIDFLKGFKQLPRELLNASDSLGKSPLVYAIEFENHELVSFLLEKGADPNLADAGGAIPLQLAREQNLVDILATLHQHQFADWKNRKNKFTDDVLLYAIESDNALILEKFLTQQTSPDYAFPDTGVPLLTQAIFEDSIACVSLLLANKANPNIHFDTRPALTIAAMFGQYEICKMLLEAGANPDETDGPHTTALMFAAEEGHAEVVKLLLEFGANPNRKDLSNETALDKAVNNQHIDVVRLF